MIYNPWEPDDTGRRRKRSLGRQSIFGLIILLVGIIVILISCLIHYPKFDPEINLFGIGCIWLVGGAFLMLSDE